MESECPSGKYRSCPFSQFLSHGLKLQERKYRLDSLDIGRFSYGYAQCNSSLHNKQIDYVNLDEKTCLAIVEEEVDKLVPKPQKEILLSSNRYSYLSRLKTNSGTGCAPDGRALQEKRIQTHRVEISFGTERTSLHLLSNWRRSAVQR